MQTCRSLALTAALIRSSAAEPTQPTVLQRSSVCVSYGIALPLEGPSRRERRGAAFRFGFGQRLTSTVSLLEDVTAVIPLEGARDTPRAVQHADLGVGVLWLPLTSTTRPGTMFTPLYDPSSLIIKLSGGVSVRDASNSDAAAYGPMLSTSFGYLPFQGLDYAFGLEVRGVLALFEGEPSASVDALLTVQLAR